MSAGAAMGDRALWPALVLLLVLVLAVVPRGLNLDGPAQFDELYHLLAARSWLESGTFDIARGEYTRTPLFTLLMAAMFSLFGESLEVARLPSVIAGSALVLLVFLWLRWVAGWPAGLVAASLLALWPDAILISQFARFYALHALIFWFGAFATYALVLEQGRSWGVRLALGLAATVCYGLALHFQTTTLIGLAGIGLWVVGALAWRWQRARGGASGRRRLALAAGAAVAGLALALLLGTDLAADLLRQYRAAPLWASERANQVWFYHADLGLHYPTLWPLFPLASFVAIAARPRPALFCLCLFATAFVLHSFAGPKDIRYLYYAMPCFFMLWGIALESVVGACWRFLVETGDRVQTRLGRRRPSRLGRWAVIGAVTAFLIAANTAFVKTAALLLGVTLPPIQKPADWPAAAAALEPALEDASIVLTTSELEALYYLGRYDLLISKSRVREVGGDEFARDFRTGQPVISTAGALELVMDCYPDGVIVTSDERWRNPYQLDDSVADLIVRRTEPIPLPEARAMAAFRWQDARDRPRPAACANLPAAERRPAAAGGAP